MPPSRFTPARRDDQYPVNILVAGVTTANNIACGSARSNVAD
jgi:hypothetical protein